MTTEPLISTEDLERYHLAVLLRWLLRDPYHDYPLGWPASWRQQLHRSMTVDWVFRRAGYWQAYATRSGDALLEWAAELEQQHSWLRRR